MKTLTLLRHAKASSPSRGERDFDRGLNRRGHLAAKAIGDELRRRDLRFDRVVASPAARVIETLQGLGDAYGRALDVSYDQRVYLASTQMLLDVVHEADDRAATLLIVGHNPGLESLALALSGEEDALRPQLAIKFPTATLAEIGFPVARWGEVAEGTGTISRFIRPRDLDAALGPDEDSE